MELDFIPFQVTPGSKLDEVIRQFLTDSVTYKNNALALQKKYQADGLLYSGAGVTGLKFESNPPALWKLVNPKKFEKLYVPGARHPDRAAIMEEFAAIRHIHVRELQDRVLKAFGVKETMMTWTDKIRNICWMGLSCFNKSKILVLRIPYEKLGFVDWKKNKGDSISPPMIDEPWVPPADCATRLKGSQFLKLEEKHEKK